MSQPEWELIDNLGDVDPITYGGYFVYRDKTGVYCEEGEILESPEDPESGEHWIVYRFDLDKCTYIDGVLSDNPYHPRYPTWFADKIDGVASMIGCEKHQFIEDICSDEPLRRAICYRVIGEYFGMANLDDYPLYLNRQEVEERYGKP